MLLSRAKTKSRFSHLMAWLVLGSHMVLGRSCVLEAVCVVRDLVSIYEFGDSIRCGDFAEGRERGARLELFWTRVVAAEGGDTG